MITYLLCLFMGLMVMSLGTLLACQPPTPPAPPITLRIVKRDEWGAKPPKSSTPLHNPLPYVTVHHSSTPPACYSLEECAGAMRIIQHMHMDDNGWDDIGYNFGIGSDGLVYEGRGWNNQGAHAKYFNSVSIGICLIGDWTNSIPPAIQTEALKDLINVGVQIGSLTRDYRLVGHRQVRDTECPGEALYSIIKDWKHFSNFPRCTKDLVDIQEISDSSKAELLNLTACL